MAKLKNVTAEELKAFEDQCFDVGRVAADLHRRASQGYADTIPGPLSLASSFASMSRTLAELSAWCLMKAALQEQERLIEDRLTQRHEGRKP